MTADGNLERIREDLIRRARMERGFDLEQGLPHGNSPEELGEEEERARGGLAGLFTRMNERRQQRQQMPEVEVVEEPKSPVVVQQAAGHRFTLPRFSRFWASGANGPGSPAPSHSEWPSALPTFNTDHQAGGLSPPQLATHARSTIRAPSSFYSSMEDVSTSQDTSSSRPRHERRHGRRRHKHKKRGHHRGSRKRSKKQPKRFLGCFPWVKSREMRAQILRCFVTGLFLVSLLSVYLALSLTKNIQMGDFTIVLIVIIVLGTLIFCYGLVRLCVLVLRRDRERVRETTRPEPWTPGVYKIPEEPIQVRLASDEEAVGAVKDKKKVTPPAYGMWRESVRADPDRLYWKRNEETVPSMPEPTAARAGPRPPSYASDDGVSYVVEAVPRSVAPSSTESMPPHPSEVDRISHNRAAW
ncbi:unnamed protein product [Clonostachys byssicola]|uniref:Uncharacterized protein n=1 Tax=Clonostachys byssicola TaxID=160290 RepID=A0A9N9UBA5_9HYPO|nr:unnamed protein product [Clonostachys byssicola]